MKFTGLKEDSLRLEGLSGVGSAVQKDANGLPVAWPLFKIGKLSITKGGKKLYDGEFTAEDATKIEAHFKQKGEKIPIDCNHLLAEMAKKLGKTEAEVAALTGEKHLAAGFCNLEKRADGIYATDANWVPLAGELLKQGMFRHFSPVLRGLQDDDLRITSIALLNTPAIDNQDVLAASAEFGSELATAFKTAFNLTDKPDAVALGALVGITEKLKGYDSMKSRLDALELSAEKAKKDSMIEDGLKSGKLTKALLPWANGVDALTLSGFLAGAAPVVAVGSANLKPKQPDAIALSAEDKDVCKQLGVSEEEMLKTKKTMSESSN